jgi:hypothetical protein
MRNGVTAQRATRNPGANDARRNSRNRRMSLRKISVGASATNNSYCETVRCAVARKDRYIMATYEINEIFGGNHIGATTFRVALA